MEMVYFKFLANVNIKVILLGKLGMGLGRNGIILGRLIILGNFRLGQGMVMGN